MNNLIVFEGIDCSGKSTQIKLLEKRLSQNDILYSHNDIVNFDSSNTVKPTFISQHQSPDLFPTVSMTRNVPTSVGGHVGFPKGLNYAASSWKDSSSYTYKASVFLTNNIKSYYPVNNAGNSRYKQENVQTESYLWILEKVI